MWFTFFLRAYRACLAHTGDEELAGMLKPICTGRVPDFANNGGESMRFVNAAIKCAEDHTAVTLG